MMPEVTVPIFKTETFGFTAHWVTVYARKQRKKMERSKVRKTEDK